MSEEVDEARSGKADPEPLAVVTLCVGTLAMLGAVANAYVNYRRFVRDEADRVDDATSDFLGRADKLRSAGDRLLSMIRLAADHGQAAFSMAHTARGLNADEEPRARTLRAGDTSVEMPTPVRRQWSALVAEVARSAEGMDEAVEAYDAVLSDLLASGRRIEAVMGVRLEGVVGNVIDRSMSFRKALDSYQNLRSGNTLMEAETRFNRLRMAAAALVEAANGFVGVGSTLARARQSKP